MWLELADGKRMMLPDDLDGYWGVILVYRGDWPLYCHQQLADFQLHLAEFEKRGARVLALSADPIEGLGARQE